LAVQRSLLLVAPLRTAVDIDITRSIRQELSQLVLALRLLRFSLSVVVAVVVVEMIWDMHSDLVVVVVVVRW
jgi:hypothetical protein